MNKIAAYCRHAFRTVAFLCLCLAGASAHALSAEGGTEQVKARLVASVDGVHPGQQILLGVEQHIQPQWHTYWINPGDSGIGTRIAWDLPEGASAGEIQWPIPGRFKLGPITSYGYENEVTLLSAITVPTNVKAGNEFLVKATVRWLACRELCIPQQAELGLALPVLGSARSARSNPLIAKARTTLPADSPWPAHIEVANDRLSLRITGAKLRSSTIEDIWFYTDQRDKIAHGAAQPHQFDGDNIVLDLQPGETPPAPGQTLTGVLVLTERNRDGIVARGFNINAVVSGAAGVSSVTTATAAPAPTPVTTAATPSATSSMELPAALLLAVLSGMVLNLMPCVFPILSIKALSLLNHAHEARLTARLHGLAYTLGVLASFAVLGEVLIVLKAGGAQIGWGFQFQSPFFVLAMTYLMFAVGLNLSGVFTIGSSLAGIDSSLAARAGYSGSFFTGVLATVVATPCTAPFMGSAVGFALSQPPAVLMAVMLCMGIGLALPYLLLCTWPVLQRRLPRPGLWMERIKQGLAFPMYAAAAWLIWVLAQQAGLNAIAIALTGMVLIAFAAWLFEAMRTGGTMARYSGTSIAVLALATALAGGYVGVNAGSTGTAPLSASASPEKNWEPYSAKRMQTLRANGNPVFLNLTAAWCITCLVNERIALQEAAVIEAFNKSGIAYLKGDWTSQDQQITRLLAEFGRRGVPLYVFYPAGTQASPVVLPQLLTPEIVLGTVNASSAARSSVAIQPAFPANQLAKGAPR